MLNILAKGGFLDIPLDFYEAMRGLVSGVEFSTVDGIAPEEFNCAGIPVSVVHASHFEGGGINFVNPDRFDANIRELRRSIAAADFFGSEFIVVHPERREPGVDCSLEHFRRVITECHDPRIVVENMHMSEFFLRDPAEIAELMEDLDIGFILDVGHAAGAAFLKGIPQEEYLRSMLALNPSMLHLSDTRFIGVTPEDYQDGHLHLGHGDIDWMMVLRNISTKDIFATLETSNTVQAKLEDIAFLRSCEQLL
jgi:sugar phosphate isomerase/epimerase